VNVTHLTKNVILYQKYYL